MKQDAFGVGRFCGALHVFWRLVWRNPTFSHLVSHVKREKPGKRHTKRDSTGFQQHKAAFG
jgi:hypothetical protein